MKRKKENEKEPWRLPGLFFLFGNLKKPELVPVLCGRINLLRKKKVLRDNLQEK